MSGHFSALLQTQAQPSGPRVPVSVLTGFLGSGKTTLLNRLLSSAELAGTAVIVNEFGETGLDHELLTAASADDVVLLPNGCLCCAVRGDLVKALSTLLDRPGQAIHRVVIETSGLAEPGPILRTLMLDPLLSQRYRLGTVLCTVDAVLGLQSLERHPEALAQLAAADEVWLTKPSSTRRRACARLAVQTWPPCWRSCASACCRPDLIRPHQATLISTTR